jgi:hypothetical protein
MSYYQAVSLALATAEGYLQACCSDGGDDVSSSSIQNRRFILLQGYFMSVMSSSLLASILVGICGDSNY